MFHHVSSCFWMKHMNSRLAKMSPRGSFQTFRRDVGKFRQDPPECPFSQPLSCMSLSKPDNFSWAQCHPVPTSNDFKLGLHHYFMEKITVVHMSHHFSHEFCEKLPKTPPLPTVEALVSRKRLADKPSVGAWADCC